MSFDVSGFISSFFSGRFYFLDVMYSCIVVIVFCGTVASISGDGTSMGQLSIFFENINLFSFSAFFQHLNIWFLGLPDFFDYFLIVMICIALVMICVSDYLPIEARINFTFLLLLSFCVDRSILFIYPYLMLWILCILVGSAYYAWKQIFIDKRTLREALINTVKMSFIKLFTLVVALFSVPIFFIQLLMDPSRLFYKEETARGLADSELVLAYKRIQLLEKEMEVMQRKVAGFSEIRLTSKGYIRFE